MSGLQPALDQPVAIYVSIYCPDILVFIAIQPQGRVAGSSETCPAPAGMTGKNSLSAIA
jgi:hypothetical protein